MLGEIIQVRLNDWQERVVASAYLSQIALPQKLLAKADKEPMLSAMTRLSALPAAWCKELCQHILTEPVDSAM